MQVSDCDAATTGAVLYGISRLTRRAPHHPPSAKWLADFGAQAASGFPAASPEALAQMLTGLAAMGWAPGGEWMAGWEARAAALLAEGRGFTGSQAADLAAAYQALQRPVPPALAGAVGGAAPALPAAAPEAGGAEGATPALGDQQQAAAPAPAPRLQGLRLGELDGLLGRGRPGKVRRDALPTTRQQMFYRAAARRQQQQEAERAEAEAQAGAGPGGSAGGSSSGGNGGGRQRRKRQASGRQQAEERQAEQQSVGVYSVTQAAA